MAGRAPSRHEIVQRKYQLIETIGQGSFGKVRVLLSAALARVPDMHSLLPLTLSFLSLAHAYPPWQVKRARCRSTNQARAVKIIDKRLIGGTYFQKYSQLSRLWL